MTTQYKKYDVYFKAAPSQTGPFWAYIGAYTAWAANQKDAEYQATNWCRSSLDIDIIVTNIIPL